MAHAPQGAFLGPARPAPNLLRFDDRRDGLDNLAQVLPPIYVMVYVKHGKLDAASLVKKMTITYFLALPFVLNDDGELVPGEAEERLSADDAMHEARLMVETSFLGAAAFSCIEDRAAGVTDLVVIEQFGAVPRQPCESYLSRLSPP